MTYSQGLPDRHPELCVCSVHSDPGGGDLRQRRRSAERNSSGRGKEDTPGAHTMNSSGNEIP